MKQRLMLVAATIATVLVLSNAPRAYVTNGVSWNQQPVAYWINTTNLDLPDAAVESAVQAGANAWSSQTSASIRFSYAGRSAQSTNTFDGVNLVMFRDAANGSAIATTYWWSSASHIIDADIVFWDGGFRFFSGSAGCSGGFYIEDIAAHEFGHALGLGHSASAAATMFPSVSTCATGNRTLDADDIAGVLSLYPPSTPPTAPTGFHIVGS